MGDSILQHVASEHCIGYTVRLLDLLSEPSKYLSKVQLKMSLSLTCLCLCLCFSFLVHSSSSRATTTAQHHVGRGVH